jgi:tetratricopeptide (TPR) repeat protein
MQRASYIKKQLWYAYFSLQLISVAISSFGQKDTTGGSYVTIAGIAEKENEEPISGVTVDLYKQNNKINSIVTKKDGVYKFKLEINNEYSVKIFKEGLISKNFYVNTTVPDYERKKGTQFEIAFSISLFKACPTIDLTLLQSPVVKLAYSDLKRDFIPDKVYDKVMLSKLQQLVKDNDDCWEEQYKSIVRKADQLFNEKKYLEAKDVYETALNQRPDDKYVQDQIAEIKRILSQQKSNDKTYNDYIANGDKEFNGKNYPLARIWYSNALELKPGSEYPQKQIAEIDRILAEKEKQAKQHQAAQEKYKQMMDQGDDASKAGNYTQAKQAYQQALDALPGDPDATRKIAEMDNLLQQQHTKNAEQKNRMDNYNASIAKADALFKTNKYNEAKSEYQNALNIMPDEDYPKQKIKEIDKILKNNEKQRDQQFADYIKAADKAFDSKDYINAKTNYQNALNLKAGDAYATSQINIIDKIFADQQKKEAEQRKKEADLKATEDAYNNAIAKGDGYFNSKQYDEASNAYKQALSIKPSEKYPQDKLAEIAKIKKQIENENNYKNTITEADGFFNKKQYEQAKTIYQKALTFKPDDLYAKNQIDKIDKANADELKKLADQKAKQDAFDKAIAEGDKFYNSEDYETAKNSYQKALTIFPDNPYAKQKISDIDKILLLKKQDSDYKALITEADNLYNSKNYNDAKAKYKAALDLKPKETYPSEKIKDIDNILAKLEAQKQQQLINEKNYNDAIASGNNLYDNAKYDEAKKEYEDALKYEPDQEYPKQRIAKINEIKSLLAKGVSTKNQNDNKPVAKKENLIADLKFNNDDERQKYLKGLLAKYPAGITCEIYKEKKRTVYRYVVIRNNEANDFREIRQYWGGLDYLKNDKPITQQYFLDQTKKREGEYFTQSEVE